MKPRPSAANKAALLRPGRIETVLLALVCGITALRATYIEAFQVEQTFGAGILDKEVISLMFSTILFACLLAYFLRRILQRPFTWRTTWFGWAALVFAAAGIVAAAAASDKRAAITSLVTLLAPIAAAALLVQGLNTRGRIRLVLLVLMATAAAAAAACADQYFSSNAALIQDYEADPAAQLETLGIEAGSLEHWMYEHRLYSKGVRGFLLTANSTASFFLLALFAGVGLCADAASSLKHLAGKEKEHTLAAMICCGLIVLVLGAGLFMTQSKGGIGAAAIGLLLFAVLALFGKRLWKRRKLLGILVLVAIVAGTGLILYYGIMHGTLPGGNSMLVRWQYWVSAAAMIRDHLLTGVGGGNFSIYYPAYKLAAASETIQDPHNWLLSLLSQYGPFGCLAFIAAVLLPLRKAARHVFEQAPLPVQTEQTDETKLRFWLLAGVTSLLLVVRPFLTDVQTLLAENAQSAVFGYIILYLMPAAVLAGVFWLLTAASKGDESVKRRPHYLVIALVCGVTALLVHNLIDFAIFEPGVWSFFWLVIAVIAACVHNESPEAGSAVLRKPPKLAAAGVILLSGAFLAVAVLPPLRAHLLMYRALRADSGRLTLLSRAVNSDRLSPEAAFAAAAMLAQNLDRLDAPLRDQTLNFAELAHRRDPADFKPLRLQAQIFSRLADIAPQGQWLAKALTKYEEALARYPGSDRLHFEAAELADRLGRSQTALEHYRAAVEIEDAYRHQFKIMYPDRQIISRIGQTNYQTAKSRIQDLSAARP
ncbi:MAG: O-antigen ligase family protein [Planctomycetaceae bacterium]|nr:O-antigen ligase family protein [Planctomycetaceae bacterium]